MIDMEVDVDFIRYSKNNNNNNNNNNERVSKYIEFENAEQT